MALSLEFSLTRRLANLRSGLGSHAVQHLVRRWFTGVLMAFALLAVPVSASVNESRAEESAPVEDVAKDVLPAGHASHGKRVIHRYRHLPVNRLAACPASSFPPLGQIPSGFAAGALERYGESEHRLRNGFGGPLLT